MADSREEVGTQEEQGQESSGTYRVSVWDNIALRVYRWTPTGDINGIVYISHGAGEYMGRYEKLGQALADRGILAFGHDQVGHGRSGGDRMHVTTFDTYVQDVIAHVKDVKAENEGVPVYLMGHSMGGAVAILVAVQEKELFDKVVLSGVGVELRSSGTVTNFLVKLLGTVAPQMGVKSIDPSLISSIEEEAEEYRTDPLIHHGPVKAKWLDSYLKAISTSCERVNEIVVPALLIHGEEDEIIPISASEFVESNIGSTVKIFKRYSENRHEVLHDQAQEQARSVIGDFLTNSSSNEDEEHN